MCAFRTAILGSVVMGMSAALAGGIVEQWGRFEVELKSGKHYANPFTDVTLTCRFECGDTVIEPSGFYDGGGTWKVRLMPTMQGQWTYKTASNDPELNGRAGTFTCGPASENNHGPVRVHKTWHFAYADGTPYFQTGTTCYAWAHQGDALEEQTLATLGTAPFNKMRMCVFPKSYTYNKNEPQYYPYEGMPPRRWDYARFNPEFFRHFERRVEQLGDIGIEADLILFHPYDRWGFAKMNSQADDRYLRYVVARLAAYRNVWWSLANEFDLMFKTKNKKTPDWDRFFRIVRDNDPYGHLRSVHNCRQWYDHTQPWVTHASIQSSRFGNCIELREKYRKPLVYDEVRYEGNVPQGWGNLSARQLVHHFWLGTIGGGYVGHGETFKHPEDILWWSKGGVLRGESPARIAFLRKLMEPLPFADMMPSKLPGGGTLLAKPGECYLVYFTKPGAATLQLDKASKVDGVDTWEMTVTSHGSAQPGAFTFTPPKVPYLLMLSAYKPGEPMRPEVKATATPSEGIAPLTVKFSSSGGAKCEWTFGDGATSGDPAPKHTYAKPGIYTAGVTITTEAGATATAHVTVLVDTTSDEPLVQLGVDAPVTLHGKVERTPRGGFNLGDGPPWKWISVGGKPIEALEGLRSFTILGWARASSLKTGSGGNRIAFNLNGSRSGFDLVMLSDGRLRLSVNEWPDRIRNDSSPRRIKAGEWVFFAVTYDSMKAKDNVRWYFGGEEAPAAIDRTTTYNRGATGTGSGRLTVGNYNETLHRHGTDRQFRGELRGVSILGSRVGSRGAATLETVRKYQASTK